VAGDRSLIATVRSFTYDALPGRVVFGAGAFEGVPAELDRLAASRVLLIADRMGRRWADDLAETLGERVAARIDDVRVHVPVERADEARALAGSAAADAIVTIGGGSATGLGKAVALERPIAILAVPTTYAGSEMTPIWGLTEGQRKHTGRDLAVQPRTVVYDPLLTLTLPASIAGPSGMNALAHCAEAIYAAGASPITTLMAEEGIRVLSVGLPQVVARPDDLEARGDVLMGAYLAGAAFAAAGSGLHHKICHVLGGAYDLPHADMHTVILPHALAFNAPAVPAAIARMARALGNPDVPGAVFDLARAIRAPRALAEIGMPAERLDEAARLIVEAVATNPRPVDEPAMRGLLGDAFEGRRPSLAVSAERRPSEAGALAPGS
jgi:alcohol dehydrogenase class IV